MDNQEEVLSRLLEVYKDRDEEYKRWENEYKRRELEYAEREKQLEESKKEILDSRKALDTKIKELEEREQRVIQHEQELKKQETAIAQSFVELEQARNELLKLRRNKELEVDPKLHQEEDSKETNGKDATLSSIDQAGSDELTPERLRKSMEEIFSDVEVQDTEEGKMLSGERLDIHYQFLFTQPPRFELIKDEKLVSKKKVYLMEQTYPGIQASQIGDKICVTGFFTTDIGVKELLQKVTALTEYLKPE